MRNHAISRVVELAKLDDRVMIVNADLGYNVLNVFEEKFPDRYINTGICEQNMASISAGLALSGNVVFTYSIGNFPTLRCIEQIRNDVCYHGANVKILSVGGGFAYGDLGMTHHATEDIAMMRALPNMRVFVPADPQEAIECINEAYRIEGPAFVRMAKGGEPKLQLNKSGTTDIKCLQNRVEKESADIVILACGPVTIEAIKTADMLNGMGYRCSAYSVPSIKPIDEVEVKKVAINSRVIVTLEEHNIIGGLGGCVSEIVANIPGIRSAVLRIGLNDEYTSVVGSGNFLREYYGLTADEISLRAIDLMEKNK